MERHRRAGTGLVHPDERRRQIGGALDPADHDPQTGLARGELGPGARRGGRWMAIVGKRADDREAGDE